MGKINNLNQYLSTRFTDDDFAASMQKLNITRYAPADKGQIRAVRCFDDKDVLPADDIYPYDISYRLDEYGFRNELNRDEFDIACFGCSVTFGDYLPIDYVWPNVLAKKMNVTTKNFGLSGIGHEMIVDLFMATAYKFKFKNAIIVFPHSSRILSWDAHPTANGARLARDTIRADKIATTTDVRKLYESLSTAHFLGSMHRAIAQIDFIARLLDIKVLYSTWADRHTGNNDMTYYEELELTTDDILPKFNNIDKARDKLHPGKVSHEKWISESIIHIKNKFNL